MRIACPLLLVALLSGACGDPVNDMKRESLGGEVDGVPKGPLHRPGQPCLVCHGDDGPARMIMSFGGTVYNFDDSLEPAHDILVTLTDAAKRSFSVRTNCVGNFFVQRADFDPAFPVSVALAYGDLHPTPMFSQVHRDGSCASCHVDPPGPRSNGHVYAAPRGSFTFPAGGVCP